MASEVRLRLIATDVYGKPISETIDIILRHQVLSEVVKLGSMRPVQLRLQG